MPSNFKHLIENLHRAQDEIICIPDDPKSRDALIENAYDLIEQVCQEMERESQLDALIQANAAVRAAVNAMKRHLMTPEQIKAQAERDNNDLFGDRP